MQCGLSRICVVWWWSYDCGGSGTETVAVSVAGAEAGAKAEASLSARMHASWRQFGYADKAFIGHIKRVKLLPRGQFRAVLLCAREQISIPNSNRNLYCCHVVYPSDLLSLSAEYSVYCCRSLIEPQQNQCFHKQYFILFQSWFPFLDWKQIRQIVKQHFHNPEKMLGFPEAPSGGHCLLSMNLSVLPQIK